VSSNSTAVIGPTLVGSPHDAGELDLHGFLVGSRDRLTNELSGPDRRGFAPIIPGWSLRVGTHIIPRTRLRRYLVTRSICDG
jgi:hypothetical protein